MLDDVVEWFSPHPSFNAEEKKKKKLKYLSNWWLTGGGMILSSGEVKSLLQGGDALKGHIKAH